MLERSYFAKISRREYHDLWASRIRRTTSISGLGSPSRNLTPLDPIVNIEPAEGGVLRTPKPLLAAEPVGTANNPIDDFLSCDPNLDFLYKILCYSSPPRASEPLNILIGAIEIKRKVKRKRGKKIMERKTREEKWSNGK